MIHDRMNEDGTPRRCQFRAIALAFIVAVTISKHHLPAAYEHSNNDSYGGEDDGDNNNDDDVGNGSGAVIVVVADHNYSYRAI